MTSDFHHLAGAYALDALDAEERAAFEAHYPTCDICRVEILEYRETAAALAAAAASAPPAAMKGRVMAEITATRQIPPILPDRVVDLAARRRDRFRRAGVMAAVAAALVAIVGFAAVLLDADGPDEIEAVLAAPDAVVATLEGENGTLQLVWSPERDQVALLGSDVPATAPDQAYALWFLLDDGVAPAGMFRPDDGGTLRSVIDVDDLAGSGFGVTIEPEGGSEQPTTPVIYSATL
jgi:anti-sigma-K factor RskA